MIIACFSPIPTNGTENANKAIHGILCIKFAIPITIFDAVLFLVIKISNGTPMAIDNNTAIVVMFICSIKRSHTSGYLSKNKASNELFMLKFRPFVLHYLDIGD